MSSQSVTPAAILQQTANSIMRLEEEMKRTQSVVDNWSKKQVEDTQLINHEHRNLMQSYKSMFSVYVYRERFFFTLAHTILFKK